MIKVTLLGDSIRMIGYGLKVPALLGDDFEVFQPDDNCRFAKYTLRGLFDWNNNMAGTKIVHWNNGLWDICNLFGDGLFTSETEYVENMLRIADILVSRYDKVIFATTTPVDPQNPYNKNSDIEKYNDLIVPLLKEKGIIINDLYKLVSSDIDKYISKEDFIHLTDAGIEACAKQVADTIKCVSKTLKQTDDQKDDTHANNSNSVGSPV
ncbi:MAG: hypothetical protein IKC36_00805 [Clostridia bacterium]|nr:hypothetical protein [Clostridia bacterium]